MKKIISILALSIFAINVSYAQTNTFPTSGNVGIGTTSPSYQLQNQGNFGLNQGPAANNYIGGNLFFNRTDAESYIGTSNNFNLNFLINGTSRMYLRNDGLYVPNAIGLGTNSFSDILSINGGAIGFQYGPSSYVGIDYDSETDAMRFRANNGSTVLNQTNLTILRSSGNVGIGTTTPSALLEVAGVTHISNGSFSSVYSANSDGAYPSNYINTTSGASQLSVAANYTSGQLDLALINSNIVGGGFSFYQMTGASNKTALMRINGAGNLGIGTITPASKLDVQGGNINIGNTSDVSRALTITTAPTASALVLIGNSSMNTEFVTNFSGVTDSYGVPANTIGFGNAFNYPYVFTTNALERMRIKENGFVGIGVTNPDQLLTVAGTVHSQEVLVNLTGFSDYVFNPTYKLPTLNNVKTYINKNHHLPDMPSAAEVVKNGLKVGETENILTKKIEELTLYLIEKDKQLKSQQEINKQQQTINQQQEVRLKKIEAQLNELANQKH